MPKKKKPAIPMYTEEQVNNNEVDVGRSTSDEVVKIREEVMRDIIPKAGQMCLLNDVVKAYNPTDKGKSNPQFHTRLRNIFHKPHLGVRIVKKDGRLWVLRCERIKSHES